MSDLPIVSGNNLVCTLDVQAWGNVIQNLSERSACYLNKRRSRIKVLSRCTRLRT